ncbi:hypothetical protein M436DRAFT_83833 [Aureobasidium namibiae CBS 147.97]|uniref:EthD domain-containing protein n=1 Tax=Aureobasidium namibiae CBS 147.97 TaxID=1043004 RepID=A0A074X896_9PEZI
MSSPNALLCWTVTAYRKDGMTEEAYHKYLSEVHGPLVRGLLAKHGFQSYSLVHTNTTTRAKMDQIFDPQFANVADYDCIIQATFRSVDDFVSRLIQNTFVSLLLITRTLPIPSVPGELDE